MGDTTPGFGSTPPPAAGNPGTYTVDYRLAVPVCKVCFAFVGNETYHDRWHRLGSPYSQVDHGPGPLTLPRQAGDLSA